MNEKALATGKGLRSLGLGTLGCCLHKFLRPLFKFLLALLRAEDISLPGKFRFEVWIDVVDSHSANWIGCHDSLSPFGNFVLRRVPARTLPFSGYAKQLAALVFGWISNSYICET